MTNSEIDNVMILGNTYPHEAQPQSMLTYMACAFGLGSISFIVFIDLERWGDKVAKGARQLGEMCLKSLHFKNVFVKNS